MANWRCIGSGMCTGLEVSSALAFANILPATHLQYHSNLMKGTYHLCVENTLHKRVERRWNNNNNKEVAVWDDHNSTTGKKLQQSKQ